MRAKYKVVSILVATIMMLSIGCLTAYALPDDTVVIPDTSVSDNTGDSTGDNTGDNTGDHTSDNTPDTDIPEDNNSGGIVDDNNNQNNTPPDNNTGGNNNINDNNSIDNNQGNSVINGSYNFGSDSSSTTDSVVRDEYGNIYQYGTQDPNYQAPTSNPNLYSVNSSIDSSKIGRASCRERV